MIDASCAETDLDARFDGIIAFDPSTLGSAL